jgi:hypothetical protein
MLLPLLYPSQRYPLFCLCIFYCCLSVFLCFLFCTSSVPIWQGVPLLYFRLDSCHCFVFGIWRILCGLRLNGHHHLLSTTSHLRESFTWERSLTSLISFRGWFTGVTHIYLSLIIRGISSHGMVGNCRVSSPSVHISHSVDNLEIETGRRPIYLLFVGFWLFIS